jgi:hypothetical protein
LIRSAPSEVLLALSSHLQAKEAQAKLMLLFSVKAACRQGTCWKRPQHRAQWDETDGDESERESERADANITLRGRRLMVSPA